MGIFSGWIANLSRHLIARSCMLLVLAATSCVSLADGPAPSHGVPMAGLALRIANAAHPGFALDIANDHRRDNRPVLAPAGEFSGQRWFFTPLEGGFFRLTTAWFGRERSLDIVNDGRANAFAALAKTGDFSGQMWKMTALEDGSVRFTTRWRGDEMALGVTGSGDKPWQIVLSRLDLNNQAQRWQLADVQRR